MARLFASTALFSCVVLFAGLVTTWGLHFTLSQVAESARSAPVKIALRSGYVSTLQAANPEALNIARTTKVIPKVTTGEGVAATAELGAAHTHSVGVESLRVRAGPHKTTPQVFALKGGTKVIALKEKNGWILINADGRTGWVYRKFLHSMADQKLQAHL
jgi:hypothetical protein